MLSLVACGFTVTFFEKHRLPTAGPDLLSRSHGHAHFTGNLHIHRRAREETHPEDQRLGLVRRQALGGDGERLAHHRQVGKVLHLHHEHQWIDLVGAHLLQYQRDVARQHALHLAWRQQRLIAFGHVWRVGGRWMSRCFFVFQHHICVDHHCEVQIVRHRHQPLGRLFKTGTFILFVTIDCEISKGLRYLGLFIF